MHPVGLIGGSGLYEMPGFRATGERAVSTPYGEPSAPFLTGEIGGVEVAFLPRHGAGHRIAPSGINYRANIWGFRELGAQRIISVSASGGINPEFHPGEIVVLSQVIDMTQGARPSTFFEGGEVVHVDFTEPYCPELRAALLEAGGAAGLGTRDGGTYVCVNGPRLESRAEIRYFGMIGGDVVGMTGMPEAALARELEICFGAVTVVTNYAAGLAGGKLTTAEVVGKMREANERIGRLISEALPRVPAGRGCPCREALRDARM
ncbi:MAG: S-methyl-5'-thioadenosine phosphorylase [Thermodesulfovibrionales bacterium]